MVGIRSAPATQVERRKRRNLPLPSAILLAVIVLGCLCCELFIPKDPAYMDLFNYTQAPNSEFWFGTDTMGRDVFSMIWYGGRISLCIGFLATLISTTIAVVFGSVSGLAPKWLDDLLMRFTEIVLSIPSLLLVVLIQAILGKANVLSISLVIGVTGWTSSAKVVRTEVRVLRSSEYVQASHCMGGSFFHILRVHLAPNFLPSILFIVTNEQISNLSELVKTKEKDDEEADEIIAD